MYDNSCRGQSYKTFYIRKLRIFVISQSVCPWQAFPVQSDVLMFVDNSRSLHQSGAPEWYFTQVGSCHTRKHQTRLERLARDKHSSLLQKSINYGRKKIYRIGSCINQYEPNQCQNKNNTILYLSGLYIVQNNILLN